MPYPQRSNRGASVKPEKAKQILKDGEVKGKPITDKQEGFFGARAGGAPMPPRNPPGRSGVDDRVAPSRPVEPEMTEFQMGRAEGASTPTTQEWESILKRLQVLLDRWEKMIEKCEEDEGEDDDSA